MLYQYSWAILLAPLLAFVVIIFFTRVWDLLSRPRVQAIPAHDDAHTDIPESTDNPHDEQKDARIDSNLGVPTDALGDPAGNSLPIGRGPMNWAPHDAHTDDDEDPKVPSLSPGARASAYVALILMAFACIYSWMLLINSIVNPDPTLVKTGYTVLQYTWLNLGSINYQIAFHIDHLAIAMMVVVTTITLLVQFYSQGYMQNSAGYARFYSYLSLFAFSMLVIVFAQNFLVIFIGWELVGLSSYLLIGFWINKKARPAEQRPSPASASLQAFVVNRIGDVGFIIGIMILFVSTGTFEFSKLQTAVLGMDKTVLTIAMICIFCGAIGKSAQFPLHVWLPSAMEGPTPVSALIHAATMVAAGVYMVARTFPLFYATESTSFSGCRLDWSLYCFLRSDNRARAIRLQTCTSFFDD